MKWSCWVYSPTNKTDQAKEICACIWRAGGPVQNMPMNCLRVSARNTKQEINVLSLGGRVGLA